VVSHGTGGFVPAAFRHTVGGVGWIRLKYPSATVTPKTGMDLMKDYYQMAASLLSLNYAVAFFFLKLDTNFIGDTLNTTFINDAQPHDNRGNIVFFTH